MAQIIKGLTQNVSFLRMARFTLIIFFVTFSFQVRTIVYGDDVFWTGNFNNYSTFFLYAADILLILTLLFWGLAFWHKELEFQIEYGDSLLFLLLLSFASVNLVSTIIFWDSTLSFLNIFRFFELIILYLLICNGILSREKILKYFLIGMAFQIFLAITQYFLQGSVGLHILGEPKIGTEVLGVAKIETATGKILRSYGTFLHPNILGGALVFAITFAIYYFKKNIWLFSAFVLVATAALLFTFSRSAFLALLLTFIIFFSLTEDKSYFKHLLFIVCIFVFLMVAFDLQDVIWKRVLFSDEFKSVGERIQYMDISRSMVLDQPWGVGPGLFTVYMQNFTDIKLAPWIMQPVHNSFLLMINEFGVLGGGLFIAIFAYPFFRLVYALRKIKNLANDKLFAYLMASLWCGLVLMGLFDHYLVTSYQGLTLLFIYLALVSALIKKFSWPLKNS